MSDGYICCFCGKEITEEDYAAVHLIATNLWEREAAQGVYAHSQCAATEMTAGQFSPDALLDGKNGYSAQEIIWGDDKATRLPGWTCLAVIAGIATVAYLLFRVISLLNK